MESKDKVLAEDCAPCKKKRALTVFDILIDILGEEGMLVIPAEKITQFVMSMHPDKDWDAEGHFVPNADDLGLRSAMIMTAAGNLTMISSEDMMRLLQKHRSLKEHHFMDSEGNLYKDQDPFGVDMSGTIRIRQVSKHDKQ